MLNIRRAPIVTMRFDTEDGQTEEGDEFCDESFYKCCDLLEIVDDSIFPEPEQTDATETPCGVRNRNGTVIKLDGDRQGHSEFGEFPWMVLIMNKNGKDYVAGGSIIREFLILTGEHEKLNRYEKQHFW